MYCSPSAPSQILILWWIIKYKLCSKPNCPYLLINLISRTYLFWYWWGNLPKVQGCHNHLQEKCLFKKPGLNCFKGELTKETYIYMFFCNENILHVTKTTHKFVLIFFMSKFCAPKPIITLSLKKGKKNAPILSIADQIKFTVIKSSLYFSIKFLV